MLLKKEISIPSNFHLARMPPAPRWLVNVWPRCSWRPNWPEHDQILIWSTISFGQDQADGTWCWWWRKLWRDDEFDDHNQHQHDQFPIWSTISFGQDQADDGAYDDDHHLKTNTTIGTWPDPDIIDHIIWGEGAMLMVKMMENTNVATWLDPGMIDHIIGGGPWRRWCMMVMLMIAMMIPLIINTNIINSKYDPPNHLVLMIITKRIKLAHKCMFQTNFTAYKVWILHNLLHTMESVGQ